MCGIAGYIGQSKKPKLTFELITTLFDYLELRGTDAAGVWGTEIGRRSRVIYHKEPIRSAEFIKTDFWKRVRKVRMNMFLVHARATSSGGGHASFNANNHPFVSKDKRIGMIHNGTLSEHRFLKERYKINSDTDSEILLRMFEHGMDESDTIESRIEGIKDIWSVVTQGAMAVGIGERIDDFTRYLFLFRNEKRPLWLADFRELLGQVFFFSSPDVWYRSIGSSENLKKIVGSCQKLIEIPVNQIWSFRIDKEHPMITENDQVLRFDVDVKATGKKWEAGEPKEVMEPQDKIALISQLDDEEEIVGKKQPRVQAKWPDSRMNAQAQQTRTQTTSYDNSLFEPPSNTTLHVNECQEIIDLAEMIKIKAANYAMEGTISDHEYNELLLSLESTKIDLEGTLQLLTGR